MITLDNKHTTIKFNQNVKSRAVTWPCFPLFEKVAARPKKKRPEASYAESLDTLVRDGATDRDMRRVIPFISKQCLENTENANAFLERVELLIRNNSERNDAILCELLNTMFHVRDKFPELKERVQNVYDSIPTLDFANRIDMSYPELV